MFFPFVFIFCVSQLHSVTTYLVCVLSCLFPFSPSNSQLQGSEWVCKSCQMETFFFYFPKSRRCCFHSCARFFFSPLTCSWVQSRWACIPSDNKVWALSQRWNTINFCVGLNFSWHTFTFNFIFHPPTPNLRNVWIPAAMLRPALSRGMLSAHMDSAARTVRSEITASPGVTGCSKASWHKGVFSD